MISIVILTFNSSASIRRTLRSIATLSDDVHVVDSFSTDGTVEICREHGCEVTQRNFQNYAEQRNWAIANLPLKYEWQLHLDSDEEMESSSAEAVRKIDLLNSPFDGYIIGRRTVVFGRVLRFGGIGKSWHLRLFRRGAALCENRLYDQHFTSKGKLKVLKVTLCDHQEMSLSEWTARHNRWSDLEAEEILKVVPADLTVTPKLAGTPIERVRFLKSRYYRLPPFYRALAYFVWRYVVMAGFLDGRPGLVYHVLQGFWFRFLVDSKLYEASILGKKEPAK